MIAGLSDDGQILLLACWHSFAMAMRKPNTHERK